jgi:hypothetical protein
MIASAAEATVVYVYDDPDQLFEGQHDGTSTVALRGDLLDITVAAGSTTTFLSAMEIDTDASTTDQLQMLRLLEAEDNAEGANARYIFKIAKHHYTQTLT